ncbi:hypothetical protein [Bacillus sp. 123MFChir2]|uniref:hypothetical protein n=1 Tax=Bacillus sp. 123MFChir2 TaxID=1169144 RepID=UPI0003669E2C|nr:hypothetical protein [Bacillus sp. 123MFChir2]
MPKNRLWFSRTIIVVLFIIISWGLSTFSLFTQQEFRKFIGWGHYYNYEADWKKQMPAPHDDPIEIEDDGDQEGPPIQIPWKDKILGAINETIQNNKKSWLTIIIITATIILAFLYFKKKKHRKSTESPSIVRPIQQTHTETTPMADKHNNDINSIHNEIRLELMKWEKNLPKHNRRKSYETVQRWLLRLNKPTNIIPIYERVRYGEKEYSASELELVRRWVK